MKEHNWERFFKFNAKTKGGKTLLINISNLWLFGAISLLYIQMGVLVLRLDTTYMTPFSAELKYLGHLNKFSYIIIITLSMLPMLCVVVPWLVGPTTSILFRAQEYYKFNTHGTSRNFSEVNAGNSPLLLIYF